MPSEKERKCENCRIERFLAESMKILPSMAIRSHLEDTVRTVHCLGCKHYTFEVDNFKAAGD